MKIKPYNMICSNLEIPTVIFIYFIHSNFHSFYNLTPTLISFKCTNQGCVFMLR